MRVAPMSWPLFLPGSVVSTRDREAWCSAQAARELVFGGAVLQVRAQLGQGCASGWPLAWMLKWHRKHALADTFRSLAILWP